MDAVIPLFGLLLVGLIVASLIAPRPEKRQDHTPVDSSEDTYQPGPPKLSRQAGLFVGQSIHLATKSGLNFTVSVLGVILYFLLAWSALHGSGWIDLPYPPNISIPFLGRPSDWSLDQSVIGLVLMTVIWVGVVKINSRHQ
jgi:hypothetical protein